MPWCPENLENQRASTEHNTHRNNPQLFISVYVKTVCSGPSLSCIQSICKIPSHHTKAMPQQLRASFWNINAIYSLLLTWDHSTLENYCNFTSTVGLWGPLTGVCRCSWLKLRETLDLLKQLETCLCVVFLYIFIFLFVCFYFSSLNFISVLSWSTVWHLLLKNAI